MAVNMFVCTAHIATDPSWFGIQSRFLKANLPNATVLAGVDSEIMSESPYEHNFAMTGEHIQRLDGLADIAVNRMATSDEDVLAFLDGDAFPIRPMETYVSEKLGIEPLVAVCRDEVPDSDYPHPSFCATTVGLWKSVGGHWGFSSDDSLKRNDVGCGLRDRLREFGIEWHRMRRSNEFNPHPLLFGIYDGVLYHHGAGFRSPITSVDRIAWRGRAPEGTWSSEEKYEFFAEVLAQQNFVLSSLMKSVIDLTPDFYQIFEAARSDEMPPPHRYPGRTTRKW